VSKPNTIPISIPLFRAVIIFLVVVMVFLAFVVGLIFGGAAGTTTTSVTATTTVTRCSQCTFTIVNNHDAFVQGVVTVGPAVSICFLNWSCNVDVTGYSLVFSMTSACPPEAEICMMYILAPVTAVLNATGGYQVTLPQGQYQISMPDCFWMGCQTTFPFNVVLYGGVHYTYSFNIDTGIIVDNV
jgi:hypothetical protein